MSCSKLDMTSALPTRADDSTDESLSARRFEALIFEWGAADAPDGRRAEHFGGLIEDVCAHGLELAIVSGMAPDELDTLRPTGPGGLILAMRSGCEVFSVDRHGLKPAFRTAARTTGDVVCPSNEPREDAWWVVPWLRERGLAWEQVLRVAGGDSVMATLTDQVTRRRVGELPILPEDPSWTPVVDEIDPRLERAHESLLTIAASVLETRGSAIVPHSRADPAVLMSGIYARAGAESHLLTAPVGMRFPSKMARSVPFDVCSTSARECCASRSAHERVESRRCCSVRLPGPVSRSCAPEARFSARVSYRRSRSHRASHASGARAEGAAWMRARSRPASIVATVHERLRSRHPRSAQTSTTWAWMTTRSRT